MRWLLFVFLLFPTSWVFAQGLNAGFVQGIWYSKTPFFAGDTVRIYTAIQNNSGFDIQGTVEFVVNGKSIGESSFSALTGRIAETWADWNVLQGNHSVAVHIKKAFKVEVGKDPEAISLKNASLGASEVFADEDTDKDGVGNLEDTDDDNDGLTDKEEGVLGTNPLNQDSDEDGISDKKEVELGTNPLFQEPKKETAQEDPIAQRFSEKVTDEYIPAIKEKVNSLVQVATERLKEQKDELEQKKQTEQLSLPEQGLDLLLAASIAALPQWQIGLFLFFALAAALLLRRLASKG